MNYTRISLDTWSRANVFKTFIQDLRCVISITADIDVTGAVAFCKAHGYRFYPTFLYLAAKAVNRRDELKMGYDKDGNLIQWDYVSPYYADFHPHDETFVKLITAYSPDFAVFYDRAVADMTLHQHKQAFEIAYDARNTFDVSCLPWLHYKSCDLHIFDSGTYLAPVITWGKYENQNGKLMMPLTMQIHHAVADGYHTTRFFKDVEEEIKILTA
jgi:chloramphenicol O-acetyltransferase type A